MLPKATVRGVLPDPPPSDHPLPPGVVVVPTYKLYSPGQMGLAAFIGTPVAGTLLLGRNFSRLGNRRAAWISYVLGVLATAMVMVVAFAVPRFPSMFGLGGIAIIWALGSTLQGPQFQRHLETGGRRASSWAAVGLSLLSTLIVFAIVVAGVVVHDYRSIPPKVALGGGEVYHASETTEAQARNLALHLVDVGYFNGRPAGVTIDHEGGRYTATFILADESLDLASTREYFGDLLEPVAAKVFDGEPLDIYLADERSERKHQVVWEDRTRRVEFGKDAVLARRGASEAEARAIGAVLTETEYFDGGGYVVGLRREGRFVISFNVPADQDPVEIRDAYATDVWPLSKALGGSPLDLELYDITSGKLVTRLAWEDRPADPVVLAGGQELYYRDGCTITEARAAGEILAEYLASVPEAQVTLAREAGQIEISIATTALDLELRSAGVALSKQVFGGAPVNILLHDGNIRSVYIEWDAKR
jgi:hypothetical protein